MLGDLEAAQDDQVVLVPRAALGPAGGRDRRAGGVGRVLQQRLQRRQPPVPAAALVLGVDLLQAEDVGAKPQELRPQHRHPLLEAGAAGSWLAQALDIEGGDAQAHGSLPGRAGRAVQAGSARQARRKRDRLRRIPFRRADDPANLPHLAVVEDRRRQARHRQRPSHLAHPVEHHRQVADAVGGVELLDDRRALAVGGERQDGDAVGFHRLAQPVQRRHLLDARRAPGGPQVDHQRLAPVVGQGLLALVHEERRRRRLRPRSGLEAAKLRGRVGAVRLCRGCAG